MMSAGALAGVARPAEPNDIRSYFSAMLNLLEDFAEKRIRVGETETALVNILEDANEEKRDLADTQRAALNILDDFEAEKGTLDRVNLALTRANDAVASANQELEAFSYSVAHDMRAPLRSIDGFSLALLEDCAAQLSEEGTGYLRHIRESAQHMARLIDDLLALSRVSRAELRLTEIDLSALARAIVSRLELNSPASVEVVIAPGLRVRADPRLIGIALENLIGNAWKFSAYTRGARIEFGQFLKGGAAVFFVRDNGAGFDMAYAGKLFAPFQRLHKITEFDGTGIGLATVQRIISRHGGRIWAEGKVGHGATFHFAFGDH